MAGPPVRMSLQCWQLPLISVSSFLLFQLGHAMLQLSPDDRRFLMGLGALSINSDGDEVMAGLTAAESRFLVDFRMGGSTAAERAEYWLYHQILRTHLRARLEALYPKHEYAQAI